MQTLATDVQTVPELRRWIRDGGGIRRGDYGSRALAAREVRAEHGWLDRRAAAYSVDDWAAMIASGMPWFGVEDANDLHAILTDDEGPDYAAEYRRALRSGPREDEVRVRTGRALAMSGVVERVGLRSGDHGLWLAMSLCLADGTRIRASVPRGARRALEAAGIDCSQGTERALLGRRVSLVADVEPTADPRVGQARRPRRFAVR